MYPPKVYRNPMDADQRLIHVRRAGWDISFPSRYTVQEARAIVAALWSPAIQHNEKEVIREALQG